GQRGREQRRDRQGRHPLRLGHRPAEVGRQPQAVAQLAHDAVRTTCAACCQLHRGASMPESPCDFNAPTSLSSSRSAPAHGAHAPHLGHGGQHLLQAAGVGHLHGEGHPGRALDRLALNPHHVHFFLGKHLRNISK
ncbi:MAG: hypothetical protein RL281_541, partial [Pseudomonadota bacterium]